jgi:hypothetical protein
MWRNWSPHEKKKYYEWALKNLPNPPASSTERPNMEVYSTYVEASHELASLREDTERRGLCIFFGDDGVEQRTPVDSVGGESLHAGMDADKQRMHNDLPPPGTAQSLMHLTPARSSTTLYRFRDGALAPKDFLRQLRASDVRNQRVDEREFEAHLHSFSELAALGAAQGSAEASRIIEVPVYPGPVLPGHTNMMLADVIHAGPKVEEVERGVDVTTVFLGSRLDLTSNQFSDTMPSQIGALGMLALLGMQNVIYNSQPLQEEAWSPFMRRLTGDKTTAPGNLTPAGWNDLRNSAFEPTETEPVAEAPPSSAIATSSRAKRAGKGQPLARGAAPTAPSGSPADEEAKVQAFLTEMSEAASAYAFEARG